MARDDAGEGRDGAGWDFDLPDLGASTTPEHHRRRARPAPAQPPETGEPAGPSADRVPWDTDDDAPRTGRKPASQRAQPGAEPDDDAFGRAFDDDLPDGDPFGAEPIAEDVEAADARQRSRGARAPRSAGRSAGASGGDDLLPDWATGRAKRAPRSQDAEEEPRDGRARYPETSGPRDDVAEERVDPAVSGAAAYAAAAYNAEGDAARGYDEAVHGAEDDDRDTYGGEGFEEEDGADEDWYEEDWYEPDEDRGPSRAGALWDSVRRNRRLVLGLAAAAVLALIVALAVMALGGGSGQEAAQEDPAVVSEPTSTDPFEGFTPRPDQATSGASGPAGQACGDALTITASTSEATYSKSESPVLQMGLENTGDEPCMVNAGTVRMEFAVESGSDTVFDSQHCQIEGQDRPIELDPGEQESARMSWDRSRSAAGCPSGPGKAEPGDYQLVVSLGDKASDPADFTIK